MAGSFVSTESRDVTYTGQEGFWDEAVLSSGRPRRHWRKLAVSMSRMGLPELMKAAQAGQQLIRTNGVTYNVYSDPKGRERPWLMDPVPLVIDGAEWASIESAITQRVVLLNTILTDLYGSQDLIRNRHLPAALLFATPHFLRPCMGIRPPKGVWIQNYAADLARSPDGRWWLLADRTQAPSGLGYALENRLVSARTLPSVFSQCRIRQLARFLDRQRESLLELAPTSRLNPRVVLLTPGPNNETYFEHSFLARYWGFPLVEGADLTVRDDRVYLKTLAGLQAVDFILRRTDDSFCDPLELRGDSLLGVPGLTRAVRNGNVAIGNALGSAIVETAAHAAFLPGLCRLLLGEELKMPSVATWWCGQEGPRSYVLDHLEELVIKHTFRPSGTKAEFPGKMSWKQRAELVERIKGNPEDYVAQEQVALSNAPVLSGNRVVPRHIVVRVFAAWDGSCWSVLPGGLTRVSTEAESLVVSMQQGGGSKDTWIVDEADDPATSVRPIQLSLEAPRRSDVSPSRIGDNLFWFGRYIERVEAGVRQIRALLPCLSGEDDFGRAASLQTAIHFLSALGFISNVLPKNSIGEQRWRLHQIFSNTVYDPSRTSGIGWNLKQVRRVTWPLRERLSQDTWRVLQQLETEFSVPPPQDSERRLVAEMELLDRVILTLSALSGLIMENTTRGLGWRFLEVGRRLERALQLADLIRAAIVRPQLEMERYLETLLQIADSTITYRTRYFSALRDEHVLELLIVDHANPRSLAFQMTALVENIRHLAVHVSQDEPLAFDTLIAGAMQKVSNVCIDDLAKRDADGTAGTLNKFLNDLKEILWTTSDSLSSRYFSHSTPFRLSPSA